MPFLGVFLITWFRNRFAALARRLRLPLLGPVFYYDLIRSTRRGQLYSFRVFYAGLLLIVLFLVYLESFQIGDVFADTRLSISDRAGFAGRFFSGYMMVQIVMILLVTPTYTAGVIAEEKQRRTFEFLLATDLSNREIVLGLLSSRLANLLLFMLTGLPVLSLLPFMGGVSPLMVLAGFVVSSALLFSLGSLSILNSLKSRTPLGAVVFTYVWLLFFLLTLVCPMTACANPFLFVIPGLVSRSGPVFIDTDAMVLGFLIMYVAVHGAAGLTFLRLAILRVRRIALSQAEAVGNWPAPTMQLVPTTKAKVRGQPLGWGWGPNPEVEKADITEPHRPESGPRHASRWPPIGADALFWKELYANDRFVPLRLLPLLFGLGLFGLLFHGIVVRQGASQPSGGLGVASNHLFCGLLVPVSCLAFLFIALSAANRISREREQHTLESLLTIPEDRGTILFAKWLGAALSLRSVALTVAALALLAVVTGGLSLAALPLVVAAWVVYAGLMAVLGLWFSTVTPNTMRATLFSCLAALLALAGPGALVRIAAGQPPFGGYGSEVPAWYVLLADYGLTPPVTLWVLCFRSVELTQAQEPLLPAHVLAAIAGLHCYLVAAGLLWLGARARLLAVMGPKPRSAAADAPGKPTRSSRTRNSGVLK